MNLFAILLGAAMLAIPAIEVLRPDGLSLTSPRHCGRHRRRLFVKESR